MNFIYTFLLFFNSIIYSFNLIELKKMSTAYWRILFPKMAHQGGSKNVGKLLIAAGVIAPLIKDSTTAEQKSLEEERAAKRAAIRECHQNENFPIEKQVPRTPMTTLPSSFDSHQHSYRRKRGRDVSDNPILVLGVVATGAAILYMMYSMKRGDQKGIVTGAKYRIFFQGSTFAAAVIGVAYYSIFGGEDED